MTDRDVKKWEYPALHNESNGSEKSSEIVLHHDIEKGYREGYKKGEKEAFEHVAEQQKALWNERFGLLNNLIQYLQHPVLVIDKEVEHYIQQLIIQLVKRVIRHELQTEPSLILKMIQEAKLLIPAGYSKITLYLSPEDFHLMGDTLASAFPDCECVESLALKQGSFDIKTQSSEIISDFDQCVENLVNQVFDNA